MTLRMLIITPPLLLLMARSDLTTTGWSANPVSVKQITCVHLVSSDVDMMLSISSFLVDFCDLRFSFQNDVISLHVTCREFFNSQLVIFTGDFIL